MQEWEETEQLLPYRDASEPGDRSCRGRGVSAGHTARQLRRDWLRQDILHGRPVRQHRVWVKRGDRWGRLEEAEYPLRRKEHRRERELGQGHEQEPMPQRRRPAPAKPHHQDHEQTHHRRLPARVGHVGPPGGCHVIERGHGHWRLVSPWSASDSLGTRHPSAKH